MNSIQRIRNGDRQAFDNIYLNNKAQFLSWFTRNCFIDKEKAKDLYHDACALFYNNIMSDRLPMSMPDFTIKKYLNNAGKFLLLNDRRRLIMRQKRQMLTSDEVEKNLAAGRPFLAGFEELNKYDKIQIGPVLAVDLGSKMPDIMDDDIDENIEEMRMIVRSCVDNMPMPCSMLLDLTVYQEKSYQEVARIMDYGSADVAKTQRSRCFNRLRAIVKERISNKEYDF